jgi:hypothetical protein
MIFYYLFALFLLVYLHQYVYLLGDQILFKYYIKNDEILDKFNLYKRRYIIKNLWKSAILALILLSTSLSVVDGFFFQTWSPTVFLVWGTLYVSLDLSGLVYVRGLPIATKIHHIVVCILGTLNSLADYNLSGYYRSILIYTYFSIVPFIVNFYLGYRYLESNDSRRKWVGQLSYYIYTISLICNLIGQCVFFLSQPFEWSILFYLAMFTMIINDDIKLIQFLSKESKLTIISK